MSKTPIHRRILIVGEGLETEHNYFVGFRHAFGKELQALATTIDVKRGKGGDASSIVKHAINKMKTFAPNRKRGDRVFLVMDTEGHGLAPGCGRAPELPAAEKLARDNGIEIVYSAPAIEYWLLCHFQNIPRASFANCAAVTVVLDKVKYWKTVCKSEYDKADQDVFDRLSHGFDVARKQSLEIDLHHLQTTGAARKTNPSTQIYELIAILIGTQAGEKCPIAGTWELIGITNAEGQPISKAMKKGETMPMHGENIAHWQLINS